MKCPSCDFEAAAAAFGDPLRCPDCGAYYEKAVAFNQRKLMAAEQQAKLAAAPPVAAPAAPVRKQSAAGHLYCPSCGARTFGKTHTRGSIFIELVLWLAFLIPGLIYSIWRLASRQQVCTACNAPGLIPVNSPRARKELAHE